MPMFQHYTAGKCFADINTNNPFETNIWIAIGKPQGCIPRYNRMLVIRHQG